MSRQKGADRRVRLVGGAVYLNSVVLFLGSRQAESSLAGNRVVVKPSPTPHPSTDMNHRFSRHFLYFVPLSLSVSLSQYITTPFHFPITAHP